MGHSGGKITAPVNTYDIKTVLGETSDDVGTLCTSLKINKAAKYKPIPYKTVAELTIDQRAGSSESKALGIYYGVQFGVSVGTTFSAVQTAGRLVYDRPADYYRMTDFIGYDHNAVFNPQGYIYAGSVVESDQVRRIKVTINEPSTANTTGVSLVEVMKATGISTSDAPLDNAYPCIMIQQFTGTNTGADGIATEASGNGTGSRYIRALCKSGVPVMSDYSHYKTMRTSDTWNGSVEAIANDSTAPSFLGINGNMVLCTVFFARSVVFDSVDLRKAWYQIGGSGTYAIADSIPANMGVMATCPGAGYHVVHIQQLAGELTAEITYAALVSTNDNWQLQCGFKFSGMADSTTWTISVVLYDKATGATLAQAYSAFKYDGSTQYASLTKDTGITTFSSGGYTVDWKIYTPVSTLASGTGYNVTKGLITGPTAPV